MKPWIDVSLKLPNVAGMSDEEVAAFFDSFDGRWSSQTKRLMKTHGATGLDLNRNWVVVGRIWTCPCCGREKPEIVRKADNGVLLARLELHHDHIRETVNRLFREQFGDPWMRHAPPDVEHLDNLVEAIVERFGETLVCLDCNAAEGRAKAALKGIVSADFTFRPEEIKAFISARPNQTHELDVIAAERIWRSVHEDWQQRLGFIREILDRITSGQLTKKRHRWNGETIEAFLAPDRLVPSALRQAARTDPILGGWLEAWFDSFLARSISNDGDRRSLKPKKKVAGRVPTSEEITRFVTQRPGAAWNRASEDWTCPCCGRAKSQTLRFSNKGELFGQLRTHIDYFEEDDERCSYLRRKLYRCPPAHPVIGSATYSLICSDCADVVSGLGKSRPDLKPVRLNTSDIRSCLRSVVPHAAHDIDIEHAAQLASSANEGWTPAVAAFEQHRKIATGAYEHFRIQEKLNGPDAAKLSHWERHRHLLPKFTDDLEIELGLDESVKPLDFLLAWLLDEGQRLQEEEACS